MTPFDIDPTQIEQLGGGFGTFVFHLLDAERAAHGMGGHQLTFNKNRCRPMVGWTPHSQTQQRRHGCRPVTPRGSSSSPTPLQKTVPPN